jgi:hypothetical protein
MEPDVPSVVRYLLNQAILAVAMGFAMLMADIGGLRGLLRAARPEATLIFLVGLMTTLCPRVLATAVAVLPYGRQ